MGWILIFEVFKGVIKICFFKRLIFKISKCYKIDMYIKVEVFVFLIRIVIIKLLLI